MRPWRSGLPRWEGLTKRFGEPDAARSVRPHFVAHWWVWLLLAVLAVVGNEVVDRIVWDERHTDGDILVASGVVAIAFGSYFVARRKQRRKAA